MSTDATPPPVPAAEPGEADSESRTPLAGGRFVVDELTRLRSVLAISRAENARLRERAAAAEERLAKAVLDVAATGHDSIAKVVAERDEAWHLAAIRDDRLAEACADVAGWLRLAPNPDDPIGWSDVEMAIRLLHADLAAAEERYRRLAGAVEQIAAEFDQTPDGVLWRGFAVAEKLRALAATAPQTAPGELTKITEFCKHTDHDLSTNRRLLCDKPVGHDGDHHFVFADEPSPAVPEQEREPAGGHNADCGSCCCCSVDTDRLRADLAEAWREAERLRGGVVKIADDWDAQTDHVDWDAVNVVERFVADVRALLSPTPDTPEAEHV